MKKIAVIGLGYVGLITTLIFADAGYEVVCIDKDKNKINLLKNKEMPFYEKQCNELLIQNYDKLKFIDSFESIDDINLFFVCVGTPLIESKKVLDLSGIEKVIEEINKNIKLNDKITICIRSTILPGTCEKLENSLNNSLIHIIHNPEFLSQGSAINDSVNATRIVIGSEDNTSSERLCEIYTNFLKNNNKNIPILIMKRKESEMVKFMANSYLAMRISFINEISNLCEKLNIDVSTVIDGVKYDNRIGGHYFKRGIGYGGSCLPKDTKAIVNFSVEKGSPLTLIETAVNINEKQLKKCFDKIKYDFPDLSEIKIALLGTTFKPETDDIRNSCSLYLTNKLLSNNAIINVYDPKGLKNYEELYGNKVNYYNNIKNCVEKCNIIILATEWDEFKNYNFNEIALNREIYIYDFKSCLNINNITNTNIKYRSIGGK